MPAERRSVRAMSGAFRYAKSLAGQCGVLAARELGSHFDGEVVAHRPQLQVEQGVEVSAEEQTIGHMVAVLSEVAVDMGCFQDRLDVESGDCATTFIRCQQCATELGLTVSHSNGSLSAFTDIVALLIGGKAGGQLYIDDGEWAKARSASGPNRERKRLSADGSDTWLAPACAARFLPSNFCN